MPRALWAEVTGPAESVEDAVTRFPNAARTIAPLIEVAMNASVDDLELHLAFDATHGINERKFFHVFLRESPVTLRQARPAKVQLLKALTQAIGGHPEHARLQRAAAHYQQALRHWGLGDEIRAVSQLWMGMEALTPIAKRDQKRRTGTTTDDELANALSVEKKALDATLRRVVLFQDEKQVYADAKDASDAFEHGFKRLDEIRRLAHGVRDRTAALLRTAIVNFSELPDGPRAELLGPPLDEPIVHLPITKYLRGTLRGDGDPAAPDQQYPRVAWKATIKTFRVTPEGKHEMTWEENITPICGEGITLSGISVEMWSVNKQRQTVEHRDAVVTPGRPTVTRRRFARLKRACARVLRYLTRRAARVANLLPFSRD